MSNDRPKDSSYLQLGEVLLGISFLRSPRVKAYYGQSSPSIELKRIIRFVGRIGGVHWNGS